MKPFYLILSIPLFLFFALSVNLDHLALVTAVSESKLTPYLAARSIAKDRDLAYTRTDADRFFREQLVRPSNFQLVRKKILVSSGETREYYAFYYPNFYLFALVPMVAIFSTHGVLALHFLLLALIFWMGFLYWRSKNLEETESAINVVAYCTLLSLPILFLIPSHHLFLFALISAAIFFASRNRPVLAAVMLGLAVSVQPLSIVPAVWLLLQMKKDLRQTLRFVPALAIMILLVWGAERLMYPPGAVSESRTLTAYTNEPLASIWQELPIASDSFISKPEFRRIEEFLFGRTIGFLPYGFVAFGLMLSGVWLWRETLIIRTVLFVFLFLLILSLVPPARWQIDFFCSDPMVILASVMFFVLPIVQPKKFFFTLATFSLIFAGPLLANPAGTLLNRTYYLQSFPFRYFPSELSLLGKSGLTRHSVYRLPFEGGIVYLLNDHFYREEDFLWVRGESTLEFILAFDNHPGNTFLSIRNGELENQVRLTLHDDQFVFKMRPRDVTSIDLSRFRKMMQEFEGRFYLHGKIQTSSGFVPKLLSRENVDYRFLGCQIHIITN